MKPGKASKKGESTEAQKSENPVIPEEDATVHHEASFSPSQSLPSSDGGVALMDLELSNWDSVQDTDLSSLLPETSSLHISDLSGGDFMIDNAFDQSAFPELPIVEASTSQFSSPLSFEASSSASSDLEFPDSYLLPVHELTILKALMRISGRIGCDSSQLWSIDCLSPFNQGAGTPSDQLPVAWRPTASQITIPHHPVFDFLPWPSARDRVLMILSLPDASRPANAQGPLALVNFVYDLEHGSEGIRIYGGDPYDPNGWEVGQVLFERWWFLFDREIIENSNRWRELRGAPPLLLKGQ